MISPELIRRYPFSADLDHEYLVLLARNAEEIAVPSGHYFFREQDAMEHFYLVVEGEVAVVIAVPDRRTHPHVAEQLTGALPTEDVLISMIEPGEIFGWTGLVAPHRALAGTRSAKPSRVIAFQCAEIRERFEEDHYFGYLMMKKMAQLMRDRLADAHIQLLTFVPSAG